MNLRDNISKAFNWFTSSVDNNRTGASGRKLTAIVIVALMVHGHLHWVDNKNYYDIHFLDVVFVCVLLGIFTVEQVIKLFIAKNGAPTTEVKEEKKSTEDEKA